MLMKRRVSACFQPVKKVLTHRTPVFQVSDAISEKVDSLKKGRSSVIESNHTLILGWSEKLVRNEKTGLGTSQNCRKAVEATPNRATVSMQ